MSAADDVSPGAPRATSALGGAPLDPSAMITHYLAVRRFTEELSRPLSPEDCMVQSMPDCSPTKWHLAHTSWFFETFVLARAISGYSALDPRYTFLFNSYYEAVGERHERPQRGVLSRPTLDEVYHYRAHVDGRMLEALERMRPGDPCLAVAELGLHHEQQHQELLLTDIKHAFSRSALRPAYRARSPGDRAGSAGPARAGAPAFRHYPERIAWIGHGSADFAFDNERPRHRALLRAFALATLPVTQGEYLEFMEDGGYTRADLWLSDGWDTVRRDGWAAPLYWERRGDAWWAMTLAGMEELALHEPVAHVSYYEADAYARWAGARLPTELEWEAAASDAPVEGNFAETGRLHPRAAPRSPGTGDGSGALTGAPRHPEQLFGDVWEWTQSPYGPYPGFRPLEGALGEYNGKFMCNQLVLRGGSCATPQSHIRPSYRNFFRPEARWQLSGLRLAKDA